MKDFEMINSTHEAMQKKRERYKSELAEFKSLLAVLRMVPDLDIDEISVAFVIEEIKKQNPNTWQADLEKLRIFITEAFQKEGETGVSWLMSRLVTDIYLKFLVKRKESVDDPDLKLKLDIMKKMTESAQSFCDQLHEKGEPGSFGGVSLDYAPEWYYLKE